MRSSSVIVNVLLLLLLCVASFALSTSPSDTPPRKQLAGPPSEFSLYTIPSPMVGAVEENSALLVSRLDASAYSEASPSTGVSYLTLSVDSWRAFEFAIFSVNSTQYTLKLTAPNGETIPLTQDSVGYFNFGNSLLKTSTYVFHFPTLGDYQLEITYQNVDWASVQGTSGQPMAIVFVTNDSRFKIFSRVSTYHQIEGSDIGLVSQIFSSANTPQQIRTAHPEAVNSDKIDAVMSVIFPNGSIGNFPMQDDGVHYDLEANDGVYGAQIQATQSGIYIAQAIFNITLADGSNIFRTAQHVIASVSTNLSLELDKSVTASLTSDNLLLLSLPVDDPNDDPETYRVYAEVWATPLNGGEFQPAAWVATLTEVDSSTNPNQDFMQLQLDGRWLSASKLGAPLQLRNVVVQDVNTYIVVSNATTLNVQLPQNHARRLEKIHFDGVITEEMRKGKRPAGFSLDNLRNFNQSAAASGALVLVHGYCSESNPWQQYAEDFTNPYFFLSPKSNDLNDAFAKKIASFTSSQGLSQYSAIGYSQGGPALAHLSNYYWSGVDNIDPSTIEAGSRVLQSVVSPYQGSSASGNIAGLGNLLGVGCGSNYDLSKDGAALWLAGISKETRASIWYYYVQYGDDPVYCNRGSNTFLDKPNDGVVETSRAVLPGGNFAGSTKGQCHTGTMKYPAAFSDRSRNQEMNANAARY